MGWVGGCVVFLQLTHTYREKTRAEAETRPRKVGKYFTKGDAIAALAHYLNRSGMPSNSECLSL